jgi:hypothetical protein
MMVIVVMSAIVIMPVVMIMPVMIMMMSAPLTGSAYYGISIRPASACIAHFFNLPLQ